MSEFSQELTSILQMVMQATDQGEVSLHKEGEAAGLLTVVSEALNMAHVYAVANINSLDEVIARLKTVLQGTGNFEVMQSIGNFEIAREKMSAHLFAIQLLRNNVDAVRTSLSLGTAGQTGKDSRSAFLMAVEQLRNYIQTTK